MTSTKALSKNSLKVFFDESGKDTSPNLMAALSIPTPLYNTAPFSHYTQRLRDKTLKLHWKEYTGYHKTKQDLIAMIDVLTQYSPFLKLNVINYKYTLLKERKPEFDQAMIHRMIYTKLPERIFYGLLRHYGREAYLETEVFIEKSTEYEAIKLDAKIQELLNVQSLYRNEQFKITNSRLVPKGEEIGIEITDLLLGIIRHILINADPEHPTKSLQEKNKLTLELLKNDKFRRFLNKIRYYEWNNTKELTEVDFKDYVDLFLSKHASRFFEPALDCIPSLI